MDERLGDRRSHLRFEITGQLWGSLDVSEDVILRDVSISGALVEGPIGQIWRSIRTITIRLGDKGPTVRGVVRRASPVPSNPTRQLLGIEFVLMTPSVQGRVAQFIQQAV